MRVESNPNDLISWHYMGAFPLEHVTIFIQAAEELEIPYRVLPNDHEEVKDPIKFMRANPGEQIIDVMYGERHEEFWTRVNELTPPPPTKTEAHSPDFVIPSEQILVRTS